MPNRKPFSNHASSATRPEHHTPTAPSARSTTSGFHRRGGSMPVIDQAEDNVAFPSHSFHRRQRSRGSWADTFDRQDGRNPATNQAQGKDIAQSSFRVFGDENPASPHRAHIRHQPPSPQGRAALASKDVNRKLRRDRSQNRNGLYLESAPHGLNKGYAEMLPTLVDEPEPLNIVKKQYVRSLNAELPVSPTLARIRKRRLEA